MNADRNLLFGVLALQLNFIDRNQLVAGFDRWTSDKSKRQGEILVELGAIDRAQCELLDALVIEHLRKHGGDAEKSLAAVTPIGSVRDDLKRLADPHVEASLAHVSMAPAGESPENTLTWTAGASTSAGTRFRVLRPLARGGLGAIFVAEDQELHREVALKEIQERHADNPDSRARFVLEAEITGGLEHPSIVPVYGLGTYADGRPFYAMRFIKGDSLKDAIERFHAPSSVSDRKNEVRGPKPYAAVEFRQLLGRFLDVCQTIEYAHSRGVLHRDLKPGNVMLGKYGETLVVDWGLAKPLGTAPKAMQHRGDSGGQNPPVGTSASLESEPALRVAGSDSPTAMGSALGTPAYMSPEQAAGRLDLLGPTSDVYSLGATLYSLLTGRAPFGADEGSNPVLARVERGEFPPPRSIRVDIPKPLEAICLKAMARSPADRYAAPRILAEDLEHWLADEPVLAYLESRTQRLFRWLRRHRTWTQAAAAALVAITLVSLAVLAAVDASRRDTRRQRDIARTAQAAEAAQVAETQAALDAETKARQKARQAIDHYIAAVQDAELLGDERFQPLRKKLLAHALQYYQEFVDERESDPAASADLAQALSNVGLISSRTGSATDALLAYAKSVDAYEKLVAGNPETDEYSRSLAKCYDNFANWQANTGDRLAALASYTKALSIKERLVARHEDVPDYRHELMASHNNLAALQAEAGERAAALTSYDLALALGKKLVEDHPELAEGRSELAKTYNNLGNLQSLEGDGDAALASHSQALALRRELAAENPANAARQSELARTYNNLGLVQSGRGDRPAALASYGEALSIRRKLAQENPTVSAYQRDMVSILSNMGNVLRKAGDEAAAQAMYSEALSMARKLALENPEVTSYQSNLAASHGNLANLFNTQGKGALALDHYRQALAIQERLAAANAAVLRHQDDLAICHLNIGVLQAALGDADAAVISLQAALGIRRQLATQHPESAQQQFEAGEICGNLAGLERNQGHFPQALDWFAEAIDTLAPLLQREPQPRNAKPRLRDAHWGRAMTLQALGRHREAIADAQRAIEFDDGRSGTLLRMLLADALARAGDHARAAAEVAALDLAGMSGDLLYELARTMAVSATAAKDNTALAGEYAARAVELLGQSKAAGFFADGANVDHLKQDDEFNALRARDDFRRLMGQIESTGKP